jgi:hypothetical protein
MSNTVLTTTEFTVKKEESINKIDQDTINLFGLIDFAEIFQQISADTYYQLVDHLSGNIGPRPFGSEANDQAKSWIIEKLIENSGQMFVYQKGEYNNVIGYKQRSKTISSSSTRSSPTICFSAHFDSVVSSPGADDDGSGTALFLEIARVLAQYDLALSVGFLGCNAEENGLLGSYEIAPYIKDFLDPQLVINADMLLYGEPILYYLSEEEEVYPYESYLYIAELIRSFYNNYGQKNLQLVETASNQNSWGRSDQYSFYRQDIPSMTFFESEISMNPYYHSGADVASQSDYNYENGAELAASIASTILFLSSRFSDPITMMQFEGELKPGQSRRFFIPGLDGDYFGSELRATTPGSSLKLKLVNETDWSNRIEFQYLESGINYELLISNEGSSDTSFLVNNLFSSDLNENGIADIYEEDSDKDGISSYEELFVYGTNPYSLDTDNDSLDDAYEIWLHSNPVSNDTDNDLMDDYFEYVHGLDFLSDDSNKDHDNDGLTNFEEYKLGTLPRSADSDKDGFNDGQEVLTGTDPLDSSDKPTTTTSVSTTNENTTKTYNTSSFEWYIIALTILYIWVNNQKRKRKGN